MTATSPQALRLGAAALALGLFLPFASLSLFALGYWGKAEPLVVGLHLSAALAAMALSLAAVRTSAHVLACLRHPIVMVPLALAGWSAVMAPFIDLPFLSLAGAPQSGMGALWQLDFALLIACAHLVRQDIRLWNGLKWLATGLVALIAALKLFDWVWEGFGGDHLLIWVASYYGWLGLALPALVLGRGEGRRERFVVLAVAGMVLLAGRAISIAAAAGFGLALALWLRNRDGRKVGTLLTVLAALLPGMLLIMVPQVQASASLADRRALLTMIWSEISGWNGLSWLTGIGWGRTQDVFQGQLQASGMRLWDNSWIFMSSDYFHSHNGVVEALLATGIPGALLTLIWPLVLVWTAATEKRAIATGFAVALTAATAVWFPLALSLPLIALAAASMTAKDRSISQSKEAMLSRNMPEMGRAIIMALPLLAGLILFGWAAILIQHGRAVAQVRDAVFTGSQAPPAFPADPRGDDLAAAEIIRDAFNRFERVKETDRHRYLPAARMMADYLGQRIPNTRTVLLTVTGLSLMGQIQVSGGLAWLGEDLAFSGQNWATWLDSAWRLAPGRSDLAIPLFTRMATAGRNDLLQAGVQRVLLRNRQDPVGLYFLGLLLVQSSNLDTKKMGLDQIRASRTHGIEKFMPLDPSLRAILTP